MKVNSVLAFLLTLIALVMVFSVGSFKFLTLSRSEEFCKNFLVDLRSETDEIQLEVGKGKLVKISLNNLGFEDEYRISVEGPEWVVVRPERIRLVQNASETLFVYMSPGVGVEGGFDVKVAVNSLCVHAEEVIRGSV